jgi:hypothetical protein
MEPARGLGQLGMELTCINDPIAGRYLGKAERLADIRVHVVDTRPIVQANLK